MKKKKTAVFVISAVLLAAAAILTVLVIRCRPAVSFRPECTFEYGSMVSVSELIESSEHCTLKEDGVLNTETIGEHEIDVVMQSSLLYLKTFTVTYTVCDREPPVFEQIEGRILPLNSDASLLLKDVKATDNADKENVSIEVCSPVDLSVSGKQTVIYKATDLSGNETTAQSYVIVEVAGSEASYFTTENGFLGYQKDGKTYIDGILIANKSYSIPSDYGDGLTDEFRDAFNRMRADAAAQGENIYIASGFRSYATQANLFDYWVSVDGLETALRESAKPGTSEHQTGLAADLNWVSESFENTSQFRWLTNNCYKYGFVLRYTKDGENATGYMYEPWHYRYVGEELATILWNNGEWLNIEAYFGISSVYRQ